ncbi:MAG: TonB-dependent receptor, partial [Bryobacteraceae bacterium]
SPATLGFPAATVTQLTQVATWFPGVSISGLSALAGEGVDIENTQNHSLFVNFTKQEGAHSLKFGSDIRAYQENLFTPGRAGGSFSFATAYTQGPFDNSPASPSGMGQGLAALLLGQPTSGYIDRNDNQALTSTYWSLFLHDNWRVTSRLTVDVGLRWEYEGPVTDRYNRSVRGFDPSFVQPIEAAALANYTAAPDTSLPASQFKLRGGLLFAGANGQPRELWNKAWTNVAPRLGLAYHLNKDTALRAGFGIFPIQIGVPGKNFGIQTGYNQQTTLVPSLDNGQTYVGTLASPFPSGILAASGNRLGQQTFVGQSVSSYNPDSRTPYSMRWSANVQRMLPGQLLLEVGYVGNKAVKLMIARAMNALPTKYLSTQATRDQTTINYLTAQVTNPMAGLLPGTSLNTNKIARSQLLVPYPQFGSVTMNDFQGFSWYHSMQARLERRFSRGFTVAGAYTFSKMMEATAYLNGGDPVPSQWISTIDRPHVLTFSGLFDLPFGRGRKFFGSANRLADGLIGGWTIASTWRLQSGQPLGFGNALLQPGATVKDIPLAKDQRTLDRWFNTSAFVTASAQQLSANLITLSPLLAGVRGDYDNQLDLSILKRIQVFERSFLELRLEAQNAPNHPFGFYPPTTSPTSSAFGRVTGIYGTPRIVQVMMKFVF